jgi:acyl-CoA thioester hydrolase
MSDERPAPIFFFAPFVSSTMRIEPGWIDYNGHLNMAYYHVLFDRAVDEVFEILGLGPDYLAARGASTFTAETHVLYRRELTLRDAVRTTVQLVDFDEKRLHLYQEVRHAQDGWVAATAESLHLHVEMGARKVAPFPDDILRNLDTMRASHSHMPRPDAVGRVIGLRRNSAAEAEPERRAAAGGTRH